MAEPMTDAVGAPVQPETAPLGTAPLDATPPDTASLSAATGTLDHALELLQAGGPIVLILIAFSVVALAVILVKLWQFVKIRIDDRETARRAARLHRMGKTGEALALAARSRNPAARVLILAIHGQRRNLPEATVREEVVRFGGDILETLRTGLRPLEVISTLAPLLGLFGTVLGMIEAFQQLERAGSQVNPAILSGGIWEALLTTAVGLAVAIPVIIVLNWLERTIESLAHEMDNVVTQVFTVDLQRPPANEMPDEMNHERVRFQHAAAPAGE
jgi:biopolymer transport protein ExbB